MVKPIILALFLCTGVAHADIVWQWGSSQSTSPLMGFVIAEKGVTAVLKDRSFRFSTDLLAKQGLSLHEFMDLLDRAHESKERILYVNLKLDGDQAVEDIGPLVYLSKSVHY